MMSTTEKPASGAAAADSGGGEDIKNLKAEFNRKLDNVSATLQKSQDALMAQLQNMQKPAASKPSESPSDDDYDSLFYKDPKAYASRIKQDVRGEIKKELAQENEANQKRQVTISGLYKEFPELNADDHELTQLAIKKYQDMSKEYGDSPATYKAAVSEAALELGVKPKSKRPADDDSYSVGSGRGRERGAQKKSSELDPRTIQAAELMGVDPEKVKARIKNRNKFGQWE